MLAEPPRLAMACRFTLRSNRISEEGSVGEILTRAFWLGLYGVSVCMTAELPGKYSVSEAPVEKWA